jgi:hypothetical protein
MPCRPPLPLPLLGLALLAAGPAQAQEELFSRRAFAPLPAVVDFGRYNPHIEECLAAVERVSDSVRWGLLRLGPDEDQGREGPQIVETARRCGARFSVDTAGPLDLPLLGDLLFDAAQDSLAAAVLARQLALLPADASPQVRAGLMVKAIGFYRRGGSLRRLRVAWAERLVGEIARLGWEARWERLQVYTEFIHFHANAVNDTVRFDRYARAALALADSLPQTDYRVQGLVQLVIPQYRRLRALARGESVAPVRPGIVPSLDGAFWFRRPDATTPRPTRGRPGLVAFVEAGCPPRSDCWSEYAWLRELHRRFGDALEITLVTHTHGYFRSYPPLEPAEEADLLRKYFFDFLQLPGALVVETTPFVRRQAPDNRRVDRHPLPNVTKYLPFSSAFQRQRLSGHEATEEVTGFLVDRDGQLLLGLESLRFLSGELLQAAIARWVAGTAPVP